MLIDSWLPKKKQRVRYFPAIDSKLTSAHKEVIRKQKFKSKQSENAFDTERSSINKVTVEQIWIGFRWKAVSFEDIHEVIELTVNVTAHCKLSVVGNFHVNKWRLFSQEGIHVVKDLKRCVREGFALVENFQVHNEWVMIKKWFTLIMSPRPTHLVSVFLV